MTSHKVGVAITIYKIGNLCSPVHHPVMVAVDCAQGLPTAGIRRCVKSLWRKRISTLRNVACIWPLGRWAIGHHHKAHCSAVVLCEKKKKKKNCLCTDYSPSTVCALA